MNVIHHDTKTNTKENVELSAAQINYRNFQICMRGGIVVMIVLAFIYLICLNSIATRGFALEKVKEDRLTIIKELEQVEIDLAVPLSLYALQSSSLVQDMDIIEEKEYLHVKNGRLALQK